MYATIKYLHSIKPIEYLEVPGGMPHELRCMVTTSKRILEDDRKAANASHEVEFLGPPTHGIASLEDESHAHGAVPREYENEPPTHGVATLDEDESHAHGAVAHGSVDDKTLVERESGIYLVLCAVY